MVPSRANSFRSQFPIKLIATRDIREVRQLIFPSPRRPFGSVDVSLAGIAAGKRTVAVRPGAGHRRGTGDAIDPPIV